MTPTLTTDRLTLRAFVLDDAPRLSELLSDPIIAKQTSAIPSPYPAEIAEGWIALRWAAERRTGETNFAVVEQELGLVGSVGVFRRGAEAPWEIGYWMGRHVWGRGIATEAVGAVVDWALETKGHDRLIASHFDDNPASRRVLEKVGFAPTGDANAVYSLARTGRVDCVGMELRRQAVSA